MTSGICSGARAGSPSRLVGIRYVALTTTTRPSRPSVPTLRVEPACSPVALPSSMGASVDLHAPALDPVYAARPAQQVGPANEHLARLGECDARSPALEDNLLFRGQDEPLVVHRGLN